jgi:signal transduction histidine kinase
MAKALRITLATKLRVLYAGAVLAIIGAALAVPWYFTERLVEQSAERSAGQIARLALYEWIDRHPSRPRPESAIARYYTADEASRRGPLFVPLPPGTEDALEEPVRQAAKSFRDAADQRLALTATENAEGKRMYRIFRAVRAGNNCRRCHDGVAAAAYQPEQLVGMIDITMPAGSSTLVWWTRGVFLLGGILAAVLAFIVFYVITTRTILGPIRRLRDLSDKVAEGDLAQRSDIATGDEFERLARSFNEMLNALQNQQDQLRQANRALDLRLGELSEANTALYEANRIKVEFLANVSHELRTPLNSIIGFAELLGETEDERRKRHATNILTSAKMLLGIINDLLEVAKLEAGKAQVRLEKVSVTDLCETLAQLVRPMADKKQLQLNLDLPADLPVVVTDGRKLQQIVYNLLSNAIKFTPPGGQVALSGRRVVPPESPLGKEGVAVTVADTGPGIPLADQERIFEKFSRLDSTITREHGGTGLGLAISRELTNLLGGKLTLASEPGHGAAFTLILPMAIQFEASPAAPPPPQPAQA